MWSVVKLLKWLIFVVERLENAYIDRNALKKYYDNVPRCEVGDQTLGSRSLTRMLTVVYTCHRTL